MLIIDGEWCSQTFCYTLSMRKVVGLINLFFGIVEVIIGIPYILFTIPKLLVMYESVNVELPYNPKIAYAHPTVLVSLGIINIFVGLGNFNILFKNRANLIYKVGMFLVIFSFIMTGLIVSNMVSSLINPIYILTEAVSN